MGRTFTTGQLAEHFAVRPWQVRRLFEDKLVTPSARVGAYRVVAEADLPVIERALRDRGYLPARGSGKENRRARR